MSDSTNPVTRIPECTRYRRLIAIRFAVSRRFRHAWFGAFARYDDLSGTAFENSPLVFVRRSFMAGFGFAWVFAESRERVTVSD